MRGKDVRPTKYPHTVKAVPSQPVGAAQARSVLQDITDTSNELTEVINDLVTRLRPILTDDIPVPNAPVPVGPSAMAQSMITAHHRLRDSIALLRCTIDSIDATVLPAE